MWIPVPSGNQSLTAVERPELHEVHRRSLHEERLGPAGRAQGLRIERGDKHGLWERRAASGTPVLSGGPGLAMTWTNSLPRPLGTQLARVVFPPLDNLSPWGLLLRILS